MRADPQILEKHMAVEATLNASRKDATTRLSALNSSSWCFFAGNVGAYDEHYDVFSQRARAYMNSRSSRMGPGPAKANHTDDEQGTQDVPVVLCSNDEQATHDGQLSSAQTTSRAPRMCRSRLLPRGKIPSSSLTMMKSSSF